MLGKPAVLFSCLSRRAQECALSAANLPRDGKMDAGNPKPAMWMGVGPSTKSRPRCPERFAQCLKAVQTTPFQDSSPGSSRIPGCDVQSSFKPSGTGPRPRGSDVWTQWLQNGSGDDGCLQKIIDAFHPNTAE